MFDMNNPNLTLQFPEGYDPESELSGGTPQPPADGVNRVVVFLAEDTETKPAVRFSNSKIVATFRVRAVKADGEWGAYLKDYYPTSQVFEGQHTSALANLCRLAGRPVTTIEVDPFIRHVYDSFSTEEGFVCMAKTQWIKSIRVIDPETGEQLVGADGYKVYSDIKGQARIKAMATAAVQQEAVNGDWSDEQLAAGLAYANTNPHLYVDPISGEERSVRAEIYRIVGR